MNVKTVAAISTIWATCDSTNGSTLARNRLSAPSAVNVSVMLHVSRVTVLATVGHRALFLALSAVKASRCCLDSSVTSVYILEKAHMLVPSAGADLRSWAIYIRTCAFTAEPRPIHAISVGGVLDI